MRIRLGVVLAVVLLSLAWRVPGVRAAADVHRLSVVISAVPTQVRAGDFNGLIEDTNRGLLGLGLEPLGRIKLSWLFDGEVRYFARQNLAVSVGVGRLSTSKSQEYLPAIGTGITLTAEVSSVPVHAGAAYYFTPYNQGDFQARAYVGGGFMTLVDNQATLKAEGTGFLAGSAFRVTGTNDGPGYYGELGAHLFFASRFSVLLSGLYRSNVVRNLVDEVTGIPLRNRQGQPIALDVGGAGFRMAVGIGF